MRPIIMEWQVYQLSGSGDVRLIWIALRRLADTIWQGFPKLTEVSLSLFERVAPDRAGHAARAAPAGAEFGAGDRRHLDARVGQARVGLQIPLATDDHARPDCERAA